MEVSDIWCVYCGVCCDEEVRAVVRFVSLCWVDCTRLPDYSVAMFFLSSTVRNGKIYRLFENFTAILIKERFQSVLF